MVFPGQASRRPEPQKWALVWTESTPAVECHLVDTQDLRKPSGSDSSQKLHGSPTCCTDSAKEGAPSSPIKGRAGLRAGAFPLSVLPPLGQGDHGENGGGENQPIKLYANFGAHPQAMHTCIGSQELTKTLRSELTATSPPEPQPDRGGRGGTFRRNPKSTANCLPQEEEGTHMSAGEETT